MPTPILGVKGIGPATAQRLAAAGITTLEALAAARTEQLADLPGFGAIRAKQIIAEARNAVGNADSISDAGPSSAPPSDARPEKGKPAKQKSKSPSKAAGKAVKPKKKKDKQGKSKKKDSKKKAKKGEPQKDASKKKGKKKK